MPAPKDNKYAVGHDGSNAGRPTVHQELRSFEVLKEIFLGEFDRDELLKKIETGKYNIKEALVAKALSGNVIAQVAIFNKFFPDSALIAHTYLKNELTEEEITRAKRKIIEAFRKSEELDWKPKVLQALPPGKADLPSKKHVSRRRSHTEL